MCVSHSVAPLCLTFCDPIDYSPSSSSFHGIVQARILECVAIPFSRGSSWPSDQTRVSCITGGFFTTWATREPSLWYMLGKIWSAPQHGVPTQLYVLMSFWCPFCQEPEDQGYYGKFLSLPHVRQAIHVGNQTFSDGAKVEKYLREDTVKSVKPWLTEIMNNYKVRGLL